MHEPWRSRGFLTRTAPGSHHGQQRERRAPPNTCLTALAIRHAASGQAHQNALPAANLHVCRYWTSPPSIYLGKQKAISNKISNSSREFRPVDNSHFPRIQNNNGRRAAQRNERVDRKRNRVRVCAHPRGFGINRGSVGPRSGRPQPPGQPALRYHQARQTGSRQSFSRSGA